MHTRPSASRRTEVRYDSASEIRDLFISRREKQAGKALGVTRVALSVPFQRFKGNRRVDKRCGMAWWPHGVTEQRARKHDAEIAAAVMQRLDKGQKCRETALSDQRSEKKSRFWITVGPKRKHDGRYHCCA